jgi:ribosomal protein S1
VSELANTRVGKPEDVVQVGDSVTVWVKEVDPAAGRVSLSMRSRDMKPIDSLNKGDTLEGTVTSLTPYGAFVDIGAETEGLVHVSELADHRVNRPEDVVKPGASVTVWVKDVDIPARRVSLSMRSRPSRPMAELAEGEVLEGTVSKVMDFGVFVNVGAETEGLVHVSEMGSGFVRNPRDLLSPGDKVEVRVKEVDAGRKRISLSMIGLRNDLGGELVEAGDDQGPEDELPPEPEEHQPTVVELALRKAMGEAAPASDVKAPSGKAKPARTSGLSDVYSRMIEEYRQTKGE